jgi:hypothetical protein
MTDPVVLPPLTKNDAIEYLHIGGALYIRPAVHWLEANEPQWARVLAKVHRLLNEAGYTLEELLGVADDYFGAGGSNKSGGGGGGGG